MTCWVAAFGMIDREGAQGGYTNFGQQSTAIEVMGLSLVYALSSLVARVQEGRRGERTFRRALERLTVCREQVLASQPDPADPVSSLDVRGGSPFAHLGQAERVAAEPGRRLTDGTGETVAPRSVRN